MYVLLLAVVIWFLVTQPAIVLASRLLTTVIALIHGLIGSLVEFQILCWITETSSIAQIQRQVDVFNADPPHSTHVWLLISFITFMALMIQSAAISLVTGSIIVDLDREGSKIYWSYWDW